MRSAWAGGLHLRSRMEETRGAGHEINTFKQSALIHDGDERGIHATPGLTAKQTSARRPGRTAATPGKITALA
jgi:hypothetical protein